MTYRQLASVYDLFMNHAPYEKWVMFTNEIFKQYDDIQHVVDLGCGTGEITIRLANSGLSMIGVDFSLEMLSLAEQKAYEEGLHIQWLNQDVRELAGLKELDAAVSFCDVTNYLTSTDDLLAFFKHVAQSLKVGGLFIFDIHALQYVEGSLHDKTFADTTETSAYIWHCSPGDERGEMYHDVTFFVRNQTGKYDRFQENHYQKTFHHDVYQQLLTEAGFEIKKICSDFSLENKICHENSERIFFIAQK